MNEKILEIYTDASIRGSKKKDGIKWGFGILFINPDESEKHFAYKINYRRFYKYLSIPYEKRNPYLTSEELEMFAFYVSIKKIVKIKETFDKVVVYVDSSSVFKFFNKLIIDKNGNIKKPKDNATAQLLAKINNLIYGYNINIDVREIDGHSGIYGNEIVDLLASEGGKTQELLYEETLKNENLLRVNYINGARHIIKKL